jgi:hypothetical protein
VALALTDIARAAAARQAVRPQTFSMMDDAARHAPLAPEPFLVQGVKQQLAGRPDAAERAFTAAQWRDPRSLPAAYFLADYYFRRGDALDALRQVATVARLSPEGPQRIAPYVAAYAKNRSTWPQLRGIFRSEPRIGDAVLYTLATDAANAETILSLATPARRTPESVWVAPLLQSLVGAGEYVKARAIWADVSRVRTGSGELLHDAGFSDKRSPAPFNWELTSSAVGLAERQTGGRLHALFYGQQDGVLARQLLVLPAGTYRLSMHVLPGAERIEALSWTLRCDRPARELSRVGLDSAARGWLFDVPPDCPAQWLELSGRGSEIAQQSDVTLSGLGLSRGGAGE